MSRELKRILFLLAVVLLFAIFATVCFVKAEEINLLERAKKIAKTGTFYKINECEIWKKQIAKNGIECYVVYCQKHGTIYLIMTEGVFGYALIFREQTRQYEIAYLLYGRVFQKSLLAPEDGLKIVQEFFDLIEKPTNLKAI